LNVQKQSIPVRIAISAMFFVNGAAIASWVLHIPAVQRKLGLSEGVLGLALLAVALGALSMMLITGPLIARVGSRPVTRVAVLALCAAPPLLLLAPNLALLVGALLLLGAGNGAMDVAMNAQAAALEKRYTTPIMSSFHALWSLGGLVGASVGSALLALGWQPVPHVLLSSSVLIGMSLVVGRDLLPAAVDTETGSAAHAGPMMAVPRGPLLGLGLLAFLGLVGEGAVADWSAVYLRNRLGTSASVAALGYAAATLLMATGRFLGDGWVRRFGRVTLVRGSATLAAVGLGAALLFGHPLTAIVGFGCVGLGLANLIPVLFSVAGQMPGVSAGTGIASVATMGYFGFLAGPPLIGFVAEATNLSVGLGIVVCCTALIALRAGSVLRGASAQSLDPVWPGKTAGEMTSAD